tara:strand:+ start:6049 stop:6504 length:456 start_codon:yes stop_codon:yes gene_type:complete
MKREARHKGKVVDGQLHLHNVDYYNRCLQEQEGKEIEVIIKEKEKDPTLRQYGYYFGVVLPTALEDETFGGWTKEELDGYLKSNFLQKSKMKVINNVPVELKYSPSKTAISKEEMTEFLRQVITFLAQQGIVVPESHEYIKAYDTENGKNN